MGDERSTITIPRHAYTAMVDAVTATVDAVQHAIIDKGASNATRKAAFSALLALVDAGLIRGKPTTSPAEDGNGPAPAHFRTELRLLG
jgi:hypothetical protein